MTFFPTRLQVQWAPSRTLRAANSVVVTFVVVRHRSSAARLHRQSDVTNRGLRVSKATLWPSPNPRSPGRSRMARASSIQFLSGSHSSADLQSVHARKHSAFAVALILAFVAKNPSYRIVQATDTAFRGVVRWRARRQLWWVIKMRVCIKLITRVGYHCWQLLAIAVEVVRLG